MFVYLFACLFVCRPDSTHGFAALNLSPFVLWRRPLALLTFVIFFSAHSPVSSTPLLLQLVFLKSWQNNIHLVVPPLHLTSVLWSFSTAMSFISQLQISGFWVVSWPTGTRSSPVSQFCRDAKTLAYPLCPAQNKDPLFKCHSPLLGQPCEWLQLHHDYR